MKKKLISLLWASLIISMSLSMTSLAGQWIQDERGWWYQEDDSTYPSSCWKEIEGKQYYFGSDGYMLSNTTTPDGYKVGLDGAWIQERTSNNEFSNKDYKEYPFGLFGALVTDSNVYYTLSKLEGSGNTLYCANIDGSNVKTVVTNIGSSVVRGVDNKFYYGDSLDGTFRRCNMDGSGVEVLYQQASKSIEVPKVDADGNALGGTELFYFYDGVGIGAANGSGVQTSEGFFDIASNQFIVGKKEQESNKSVSKEPSSIIKAIIPDKNYVEIVQTQESGDYVVVLTYANDPYSFFYPTKLSGSYIINTKTNTCVYHTKDIVGTIQVTELGLLEERSGRLYRIEEGGLKTNIIEDGATGYIVKHGRIYCKKDSYNFVIIDTLAPASLPTSSIV